VIRNSLGQNDFVARVGGDEFIAILDVHNEKMLKEAVNRIEQDICRFNKPAASPIK
jgi:GGDEF domain-containing protein